MKYFLLLLLILLNSCISSNLEQKIRIENFANVYCDIFMSGLYCSGVCWGQDSEFSCGFKTSHGSYCLKCVINSDDSISCEERNFVSGEI